MHREAIQIYLLTYISRNQHWRDKLEDEYESPEGEDKGYDGNKTSLNHVNILQIQKYTISKYFEVHELIL